MSEAYLNLDKNQLSQIGNSVLNNSGITLKLKKHQFVERNQATENTISVKLTTSQVSKLQKRNLELNLTAAQCKGIVNKIKKTYGGALPLLALLPLLAKGAAMLGGVGAAASGVSQVVNAVNNKSHQDKVISEMSRHNKELEAKSKGNGIFLAPYKKGTGMYLKPYKG